MGITKTHYRVEVLESRDARAWETDTKDAYVNPLRFGLATEMGMIADTLGIDEDLIASYFEVEDMRETEERIAGKDLANMWR